MKSLTELANFHGSDKGTFGPSAAHGAHNYTDIYEAYFSGLRDKPISILEIGIGLKRKDDPRIAHGRNSEGGASIKMWYDYFPQASVHAIDIVPATQLDNDRIHTAVVDQSSSESLRAYVESLNGKQFDIIIDDGSHHPNHQQLTLDILFPSLKSGGLYFIEDLRNDGLGDPGKSGTYTDRALNTRAVLKGFAEQALFPKPNAFLDEKKLAEHISNITFHVPVQHINRTWFVKRFFGGKEKVLEFVPGTELLCALRKK